MTERKTLSLAGFKADPSREGAFRATFSRFDVIDKDADVTKPGAIESGALVRIGAWGHTSFGAQPAIGRGILGADGTHAWVDGQFNLAMTAGRETYESVKLSADLQEWSYAFDVLKQSLGTFEGKKVRFLEALKVHEVAPVMVGAGIGTGLDWIKGADVTRDQLRAIRDSLVARELKSSFDAIVAKHGLSAHQRALVDARTIDWTEVEAERIPELLRNIAEGGRNVACADLRIISRPSIGHFAPISSSGAKVAFRAEYTTIGLQRGSEPKIWIRADVFEPRELIDVAAHETKHLHQALVLSDDEIRARGVGGLEEEAGEFGERIANEILGSGGGIRQRTYYA